MTVGTALTRLEVATGRFAASLAKARKGRRDALAGFAVDLGGTKIAAARFAGGEIVDRARASTDRSASGGALVGAMRDLLTSLGYRANAPLGVAVSGRVDAGGFWHAVNDRTLAEISDIPLRDLVEADLGPATILNDALAATRAEARFGPGRNMRDFAYLTVSTGVGGGLVLDRRLHQTQDGLAGHLGFIESARASDNSRGGRRGTIEHVASGRAIERAAREAGLGHLDARAVFERALNGDVISQGIIDNSAAAIADLCADLRAALGLQAVFIGGSVGLAGGYIDRVRAHLRSLPDLFQCAVHPAAMGPDGPLFGALHAALSD